MNNANNFINSSWTPRKKIIVRMRPPVPSNQKICAMAVSPKLRKILKPHPISSTANSNSKPTLVKLCHSNSSSVHSLLGLSARISTLA